MCFPFSWGKRETHKQNSQEISGKGRESPGTVPGLSRENPVKSLFMCLLVYCFFLALIKTRVLRQITPDGLPEHSAKSCHTVFCGPIRCPQLLSHCYSGMISNTNFSFSCMISPWTSHCLLGEDQNGRTYYDILCKSGRRKRG